MRQPQHLQRGALGVLEGGADGAAQGAQAGDEVVVAAEDAAVLEEAHGQAIKQAAQAVGGVGADVGGQAIAQGVGQALWEAASYDEGGQLLSGSMMTYALPRASYLPMYELDRTVTPTPVNPLGVKGVGEAGTIASPPAVINSVVDALSHLGVTNVERPATPERVWRAIQEAAK